MGVVLGSGWPLAPELPPPDAVLDRDPVTAALLNLRELLETLLAREVAPIRVEAPPLDLSSLTAALQTYGAVDAGQIGAAVAAALPAPVPQDTTALAELLKALEKLDFRMKGTGGGGSLSPDITDRMSRQLGQVNIAALTGVWGYAAGVSGSPSLPAGSRVLALAAHATSAGSLTINGGDSIPIPANTGWGLDGVFGQLVAPTLVFTGTDSYFAAYVV
jgi:hypothetical protein